MEQTPSHPGNITLEGDTCGALLDCSSVVQSSRMNANWHAWKSVSGALAGVSVVYNRILSHVEPQMLMGSVFSPHCQEPPAKLKPAIKCPKENTMRRRIDELEEESESWKNNSRK